MGQEGMYPNMDAICRLCLKENTGTVSVFSDQHQINTGNQANMSIPMRIMACVALEVQTNDGLPRKICTECRYQLEKSYLFRKQSQASDAKLRKHVRMLSLGKSSKVFRKNNDEDDGDDELDFFDSLEFIKQHDDKIRMEEQLKLESLEFKLRAKYESELVKCMDKMKAKCKEELRAEVEQSVKNELRPQLKEELEKEMVPKIKTECLKEARKSLRDEVKDECRQTEMTALLDDLQSYLKEKQKTRLEPLDDNVTITQQIIQLNKKNIEVNPIPKIPCYSESFNKEQETTANTTKRPNVSQIKAPTTITFKPETIFSDNQSDIDTNGNDDDGDSDNFLIYDTDEGFDVQKKSEGDGVDEDDTIFAEENLQAYESSDEHMSVNNEQDDQKISTISYRIEDITNGEITFLEKKYDTPTNNEDNDANTDGEYNDGNIMIINYPTEIDDEEHLDMIDYTNDDGIKELKPLILKGLPIKHCKSKDTLNNEGMSRNNYSNTSTVETTVLTKTYVNTVQRITDTPKTFKCNDCPMIFSTNHSLERHLRTHRKVEATGVSFQCPECHIVVSCNSALRRHMYIHCKEKPFPCQECGKSFVQKEILKRHMQTHTGVRPHKCPHCDRAFAQRINLRQHINRHHMEEPRIQQHSCHLCPKRFNHASGLSRHLASHSGVAFQCSECDRTFGDRSSIKRHIANKHGNAKMVKSEKHIDNN